MYLASRLPASFPPVRGRYLVGSAGLYPMAASIFAAVTLASEPAGPTGPCGPAGPVAPFSPCAPSEPFAPVAPRDGFPVSVLPMYQFPLSPMCGVTPSAPAVPSLPGAPAGPRGPAGPVAPLGPCVPASPFAPLATTPVSSSPRYQLPLSPMCGVTPSAPEGSGSSLSLYAPASLSHSCHTPSPGIGGWAAISRSRASAWQNSVGSTGHLPPAVMLGSTRSCTMLVCRWVSLSDCSVPRSCTA